MGHQDTLISAGKKALSVGLACLLCFAFSPTVLAYAADSNAQLEDVSHEGDKGLPESGSLGGSPDAESSSGGLEESEGGSPSEEQGDIEGNEALSEDDLATGDCQNRPDGNFGLSANNATVLSAPEAIQDASVVYSAHVARIGWQSSVRDGGLAGTTGRGLAAEALTISLQSPSVDLSAADNLVANAYTRSRGWLGEVGAGSTVGTTSLGLPLEAITLSLGGELQNFYDIYYRAHVSKVGWLGWASNGAIAGAPAQGKQIESVEIRLVKKGEAAPGSTEGAYRAPVGSLVYSAHVGSIGWREPVADGQTAGTVGKRKVVEALKFELPSNVDGGITYQVHASKLGWMAAVSNGAMAGTTGQGRRIEAVKISLTGQVAAQYDVYYRAHVSKYGWLDWAANGADAGTTGLGLGMEAIEAVLVSKGSPAPGNVSRPSVSCPTVSYSAHVKRIGWQSSVSNGAVAGTTGQAKSIEALKVTLNSAEISGGIQYKMHVQKLGWQSAVSDGAVAGTEGRALQAEAVCISLTGEAARYFDVYYRVHSAKYGWLGWAKNGENAGTSSCGYRMEAIQVTIVGKGASAPGSTNGAFKTTKQMPADRQAMQNRIWWQGSGTQWLIAVDRSTHKVGVFRGSAGNWSLQYYWSCVTGAPITPTITGDYYTTGGKRGSLSTDSRAKYCTQIWGGYFFHTILASENELGKSLSHGCIRMSYPSAQWIYNNIHAGTKVSIYN